MDALGPNTFDFWIGEWDCHFDGGHAVNTITREYGGKVLVERFVADSPQPFEGLSLSVHDEHLGGWRQTWVDEGGSYWAFEGVLVNGDPSFATPVPVDAGQVYKRMVFSDITPDAFSWRWESSPDGPDVEGAQWTVNWEIAYTRR